MVKNTSRLDREAAERQKHCRVSRIESAICIRADPIHFPDHHTNHDNKQMKLFLRSDINYAMP